MKRLLLVFFACLLLAACHGKQVRHLASDAAMIRPGETTLKELQQYLGEPVATRNVGPGIMEYVYSEDQTTIWRRVPMVGEKISPSGYEMIIVTVQDEVVKECEFRRFNEADRAWMDNYSWEKPE